MANYIKPVAITLSKLLKILLEIFFNLLILQKVTYCD